MGTYEQDASSAAGDHRVTVQMPGQNFQSNDKNSSASQSYVAQPLVTQHITGDTAFSHDIF